MSDTIKRPFEMTILKRVGGEDVPFMSTEDPGLKLLREVIREVAKEVVVGSRNGQFMIQLADDDGDLEVETEKPVKPRTPAGCALTAELLGNSSEGTRKNEDRERKTLQAVIDEIMELPGETRNFSCVMNILVERWNENCFKHINDKLVASIVRTLRETDDGAEATTVRNRIAALLKLMDEKTDFVSEVEMPSKKGSDKKAQVIPFKKRKKTFGFR